MERRFSLSLISLSENKIDLERKGGSTLLISRVICEIFRKTKEKSGVKSCKNNFQYYFTAGVL